MQISESFARATKYFLALVFLFFVAHTAQSQPTPTPQPMARPAARPIPPAQYIPPHDYDQRNIKLDLRFDWEREQAIGTATITLASVVKDLRRVDFDAAYMTVSGANLQSGTPLATEYNATRQQLSILLDRAYQP